MNDKNKNNAPQMIEMPEHIRAGLPESTARDLGGPAVRSGGMFGNGVITVDKGPGIPVENPGPQSINQAVANGSLPAEYVRR